MSDTRTDYIHDDEDVFQYASENNCVKIQIQSRINGQGRNMTENMK